MQRPARVLLVDDHDGHLARWLRPALAGHEVEEALDVVDAIYKIDCDGRPFDVILCDLVRGDVPGPELWSYLSITRPQAAKRIVFVASGPLSIEARAFIARVPNICIEQPIDADGLDALAARRARPPASREPRGTHDRAFSTCA